MCLGTLCMTVRCNCLLGAPAAPKSHYPWRCNCEQERCYECDDVQRHWMNPRTEQHPRRDVYHQPEHHAGRKTRSNAQYDSRQLCAYQVANREQERCDCVHRREIREAPARSGRSARRKIGTAEYGDCAGNRPRSEQCEPECSDSTKHAPNAAVQRPRAAM
jgi:hypothetical protein